MSDSGPFQVALSFAGEDRVYVRSVAAALQARAIRVFFDEEEETALWGRDLVEELARIYGEASIVVILFISSAYAEKAYPRHERRSALARAIEERREYVLPARFDDTEIPGLLPTVQYVDLRHKTPEQLAMMIADKLVLLGGRVPVPATNQLAWVRAQSERSTEKLVVKVVDHEERPVSGADVLAVSTNGTRLSGRSEMAGEVVLALPERRLVTVYVAHSEHPPGIMRDFDPKEDLIFKLADEHEVGSLIIPDGAGHVPGLSGRLNPIHDNSDRRYLYAENISINDEATQPVTFELGDPLRLEDAHGNRAVLTFIDCYGSASLLHYQR
jgi:hypothetical protein